MIQNDLELEAMRERIAYFEGLLMQLRIAATADEFPIASSGYRCELKKMQQEVLEYLSTHAGSGKTEAPGKEELATVGKDR